jgi:dipeptidyl aminopeptidase/acylaminoacyl peptidase
MAANGIRRWDSLRDINALYDHVASHMSDRIDPTRIALVGGSTAGIVVLGCIAHETDPNHPRYAVAVANSAIADLESFFERTSPECRAQRAQTYGDYTDPDILAFMRDISALRHAGRINVPTVRTWRTRPPVSIDQPRQMLAALQRNGIVNAEVDSYTNEGHMLLKRENKIRAIAGTIAFLRRTLQ